MIVMEHSSERLHRISGLFFYVDNLFMFGLLSSYVHNC